MKNSKNEFKNYIFSIQFTRKKETFLERVMNYLTKFRRKNREPRFISHAAIKREIRDYLMQNYKR